MHAPRIFRKSHKGQSMVELAISLLILLIIVTGLIEIGRLMFYYIAMRDSAQEGAMYASLYPSACEQIRLRTEKSLYEGNPYLVNVTILINGNQCEDARNVDDARAAANQARIHGCVPDLPAAAHEAIVTVRQPSYPIAVPLLGTFLGRQTLDISASMTSTIIRPPCTPTP